jgi:hypothetical protein
MWVAASLGGVVRQSPASKGVNMETEEATALEDVTTRQPVKISRLRSLKCML